MNFVQQSHSLEANTRSNGLEFMSTRQTVMMLSQLTVISLSCTPVREVTTCVSLQQSPVFLWVRVIAPLYVGTL
jgi:hypothetical protein